MPRPEEKIRRYLDAHQGSVTVTVRQAVSTWDLENPTPQDRARVARDLAAVGIHSEPPLEQANLDSRVTLRVREQPGERRAEPAARMGAGLGAQPATGGPRAATGAAASSGARRPDRDRAVIGALVAGGLGSLVALGPDRIYGYGLALGVVAFALLVVARAGDSGSAPDREGWAARLPWVAGALTFLALLLGVLGSLTIDTGSRAGTGTADARERNEFCASDEGNELTRLSLRGTTSPEELRKATDAVLDIADDAPPGANCAVLALNAVADAWVIFGDFPEYDDADEQVERIRELQEKRGLRQPVF
ncbi:MAG TPA: hypothetical protein VGW11_03325 [Solirubrobacteraceae bacterium]|nr:hypothetical protein [Solirubrobacteraceae bacterium]